MFMMTIALVAGLLFSNVMVASEVKPSCVTPGSR